MHRATRVLFKTSGKEIINPAKLNKNLTTNEVFRGFAGISAVILTPNHPG
jgi:hypothetical protein